MVKTAHFRSKLRVGLLQGGQAGAGGRAAQGHGEGGEGGGEPQEGRAGGQEEGRRGPGREKQGEESAGGPEGRSIDPHWLTGKSASFLLDHVKITKQIETRAFPILGFCPLGFKAL